MGARAFDRGDLKEWTRGLEPNYGVEHFSYCNKVSEYTDLV